MYCRLAVRVHGIEADQRVDLEIGEMKIYVDRVQPDEEIDERFLLLGVFDVDEEGRGDGGARGESRTDGDGKDEGFGIDVADFDTTFVGEEDGVTFAGRGDANIEFCCRWVG